mgnify:CR=1 FL=1
MELPIDHFRLLGVSPTTDGQTVLRTLQQRLDRAPDQGFTHETLQARSELLHASADLLSDDERRQAYERDLTSIADSADAAIAGLEIPPSLEVGGLLLLLEAGQAQEAFDAAGRGLQPPQAPALGSSREADLTLLAGLACAAAAADYRNQRRYETAARTLQQGLQLLQRMGQLPEQRRQLDQELQSLQPYRVLDLISRDLSATAPRQEGIALLEQLVQRRGGFDGDADPHFTRADFEAFFQQIRAFLTVQEQVDLFSRWAAAGSARADRLASLALTASGFMQRKPERIQAALQRLQAPAEAVANDDHHEAMAYQQLLLGEVEAARALAGDGAEGDDPLEELCIHCRDWLSATVLPGYRDIDAEADLEAWFADRDVQTYIEQQDRIRGRRLSTPPPLTTPPDSAWPDLGSQPPFATVPATVPAAAPGDEDGLQDDGEPADDDLWDEPPFWSEWGAWWREHQPKPLAPIALSITAVAAAGLLWFGLRQGRQAQPTAAASSPVQAPRAQPAPVPQEPPAPRPAPQTSSSTLTSAEPSTVELQTLLHSWLESKSAVLAGRSTATPLDHLARPLLIRQLEAQQAENRSRGETEAITTRINSLEVVQQTPRRIAAVVNLTYGSARRDAAGRVLSRTPSRDLRNVYVFARDGDTWHVAAFRPAG